MASAVANVLTKLKSGKALSVADFLRVAAKTKADEREELARFLGDVVEGRFTPEHITEFSARFPILAQDDVIVDSILDAIEQILDPETGYAELITGNIINT